MEKAYELTLHSTGAVTPFSEQGDLGLALEQGATSIVLYLPESVYGIDHYLEFHKPSGTKLSSAKLEELTDESTNKRYVTVKAGKGLTDEPGRYRAQYVGRSGSQSPKVVKSDLFLLEISNSLNFGQLMEESDPDFAAWVIAQMAELEGRVEDVELKSAIEAEAKARQEADEELRKAIEQEATDRGLAVTEEANARILADEELSKKIDDESTARSEKDTALQEQIDAINAGQNFVATVATYEALTAYDKSTLQAKDCILVLKDESHSSQGYVYEFDGTAYQPVGPLGDYYTKAESDSKMAEEQKARSDKDAELQKAIEQEATDRGLAITEEANARTKADEDLGKRIDAINEGQNFVATVASKASLLAYDTSTLQAEDCVLVLKDESSQDQAVVYKWNGTAFEAVGPLGDYYTKAEIDTKLTEEQEARKSAIDSLASRLFYNAGGELCIDYSKIPTITE